MKKQTLFVFLGLNVIVSLSVVVLILVLWNSAQPQNDVGGFGTPVVVYRTVPPPTFDAAVCDPYIDSALAKAVEAAEGALSQLPTRTPTIEDAAPPESGGDDVSPDATTSPESGGDGGSADATVPPEGDGLESVAGEGPNCPMLYEVESGDYWGAISTRFDISLADLFCANDANENTIIYPGDELCIPLNGCDPGATDTPEPTATEEIVEEIFPTATLVPTAVDTQVEIVRVSNPGDVTNEAVEITNNGALINLEGWTLSDSEGNVFTFPKQRLFPMASVTVATGTGEDTPILLHWNLNEPIWGEPGEAVTLADAGGTVQASTRVEDISGQGE